MENKRIVKKSPKAKAFSTDEPEKAETVIETHNFGEVMTEKDLVTEGFKFFDKSEKGYISCREYFNLLLASKEFTEEEIILIIKESGLEMNDNLNYSNFYDFWKYQ